jgi:hypothetical protein
MAKDKGRLPPFVPLLVSTIDTPAWRAMSHGARSLYVSLKRRVPKQRNRAYLSYREASREIGFGARHLTGGSQRWGKRRQQAQTVYPNTPRATS